MMAVAVIASDAPMAAPRVIAPALRLDVLLTVSPQLSDIARRTLIAESERIWRREQVDIEWPAPAGGSERPQAPLRVLVIARPKAASPDEARWPVAELVRHADDRALAIASIDGARRVMSEATRHSVLDLPAMEEYRLGLVLGRAVAHEIGHFLLATGTHADYGLMRASVGAREFAAVSVDTFRLDEHASRWIRARLGGAPAVPALGSAAFSYASE
jgi:hypothetical protein